MNKIMIMIMIESKILATILTLGIVPVLYSLFYKVNYKGYDFEKDSQLTG